MLIVLWMTRNITDDIPGWGTLFNDRAGDGTVSVSIVTICIFYYRHKKLVKIIFINQLDENIYCH